MHRDSIQIATVVLSVAGKLETLPGPSSWNCPGDLTEHNTIAFVRALFCTEMGDLVLLRSDSSEKRYNGL